MDTFIRVREYLKLQQAVLGTIDHRCIAMSCEGEIISKNGRCKTVRKITLTFPTPKGPVKLAYDTKDAAMKDAERLGYAVTE